MINDADASLCRLHAVVSGMKTSPQLCVSGASVKVPSFQFLRSGACTRKECRNQYYRLHAVLVACYLFEQAEATV